MSRARKLAAGLLLAVVALVFAAIPVVALSGCATFWQDLSTAISYVTDASQILASIEAVVREHADTATIQQIDAYLVKCHTALDAIARLAQGGAAIGDANVQAAIADFSAAYQALLRLVAPLGVSEAGAVGASATPPKLVVPHPLILAQAAHAKGAR